MIKDLIIQTLKREPNFRERSRKDKGFAILLKRRYMSLSGIDQRTLVAVIQDYANMDRAWRQALSLYKDLRGKDYDEKIMRSQAKQLGLGYEPGERVAARKVKEIVGPLPSPTEVVAQKSPFTPKETQPEGQGSGRHLP